MCSSFVKTEADPLSGGHQTQKPTDELHTKICHSTRNVYDLALFSGVLFHDDGAAASWVSPCPFCRIYSLDLCETLHQEAIININNILRENINVHYTLESASN